MIHILMAVYNGKRYLGRQLESIGKQTVTDWKLHIRDDGSTDGTLDIIEEFAKRYPGKVLLLEEPQKKNYGAKGNFAKLVESVREEGDYAFCDQDDIWEPDKLQISFTELRKIEKDKDGVIKPAMVCSDARIIDENGVVTGESFAAKSSLYVPGRHLFERLLLYNFAQGATMMWNMPLHGMIRHIPAEAVMHDWWVALVAAGRGRIYYIPKQLLSYRQHGNNELGEFDRKTWHRSFMNKIRISNWRELIRNNRELQNERIRQAEVFDRMYGGRLARRYADIMKKGRITRTISGITEGYIFLSVTYSVKYYIL
ncbi:MAG: glycosyltransferase family 2 protein [Lachnospiraceae bacterium]|nr:glycosyltransferase family 2 protein [Lachnospiraceae bacterium]